MPRPRQNDRPVRKRIYIRTTVMVEVDNALRDPLSGKPRYGEWSTLCELLLVEWLAGRVNIPLVPLKGKTLDDLLENPP